MFILWTRSMGAWWLWGWHHDLEFITIGARWWQREKDVRVTDGIGGPVCYEASKEDGNAASSGVGGGSDSGAVVRVKGGV